MFKLLKNYTKDGWWAAILGPIFTIIEVIFDAVIPYVMSLIIDEGITARGGDVDYIFKMGLIMVVLAFFGAISGALSGLFSSISSTRFVRNIRTSMMQKIQAFDFANIEKFPVPTVVMRLTTDMRMMRMAYVSIVRLLVRAPFNLAISAFMIFRINNVLAGIFAIAIPVLGLGMYLIVMKAHPRFRQMMLKFDAMDATLEEISQEKNKLGTILEYMADGLIAIDLEGNIMHINPAAKEMLDILPESEMPAAHYREVMGKIAEDLPLETLKENCREQGGVFIFFGLHRRYLFHCFANLLKRAGFP